MSLMDRIEDAPAKDKLFVIGVFIVAFVSMGVLYVASIPDEWQQFKEAHKCEPLIKLDALTMYSQENIVGPDGAMHPAIRTTTIPGKQAFMCDDGMIYWR